MAVRAGDTKRLNADCVKRLSKIKTVFKITCLRIQKCLSLVANFAISSILIDRPCIGTSEFIPWMTRLLIDWLILTLLVVLFAKKCLVMWILLRYIKELTLEKDLSIVPQRGKCFAQGSTLVGHLRTHAAHPHKPFKCSDCGKCFARVADFHIHQRIHTREKPYECDQCGKRFRLNSSLSKHRQVHLPVELRAANAKKNGSTVWNCEYCGKVFTINSHFRRHERTL